jgi:restriction system protein
MLPVLQLAADGEKRVVEVEDRIANEFRLSADERQALLPSGRQRILQNRIHWAKFYMSKAGLIASPARGRFVATDAGRALLASKPSRIDVKLLMTVPSFREFYKPEGAAGVEGVSISPTYVPASEEDQTPEEQIDEAYQKVVSALRTDLLERIAQNSPSFFEKLIVELLVAMGYGGSHKNAAAQL